MQWGGRRLVLLAGFLALVPLSVALWFLQAPVLLVFGVTGAAIIPLAYLMGLATEELGKDVGPGLGGLLNASFGNATEIIIAILALNAGLVRLVQASITGSIIGNLLLILGLSMLFGGLRHRHQTFERRAASTRATMLLLATVGLVLPSVLVLTSGGAGVTEALLPMSIAISILLIIAYIGGLVFSLHTHRHIFNPRGEEEETPAWSRGFALLVLAASTAVVAGIAEILVRTVETGIREFGFSELFLGAIIIAIIGNAAEHGSAIMMAWRNRMNLSVGIAAASSTQIALFVAPILVLVSLLIGNVFTLAFSLFELIAIGLAIAIFGAVANDGESNWFEGVLLLVVYAVIAVGFFFLP